MKNELGFDVISVFTRFPGAGSSTTAEGLAFVFKVSGFKAVFLSVSLRSLAKALNAPTKDAGFLGFLNSPFVKEVDPVWDGNEGIIKSIDKLVAEGNIVIAESKVGPILSPEKRTLLRKAGFTKIIETGIKLLKAKFIYLNVGIQTVQKRMTDAGRVSEFNELRNRVSVDIKRYNGHYGFNPYDPEMAAIGSDVVIDTSTLSVYQSIQDILIKLGLDLNLFQTGLDMLNTWEEECGRGSPALKSRVKQYLVENGGIAEDPELANRVVAEMKAKGLVYSANELMIA